MLLRLINRKGARGFSTIDVLIASALATIVFSAIGSAIFYSGRIQQKDNRMVSVLAARNFVYRALTQWTSLRATLVGNAPIFNCAINNTGCTAGVNANNFILYTRDSAGALQVLYNASASPKQGFDENGVVCTPAGGVDAPTRDCPVRVDFEWEPLCTSGCTDPVPIAITAKITTYDPNNPLVPAQSGFNFRLLKSAHSRTCKTPWGTTVNDGDTFTAYDSDFGPCTSTVRTCNDTILDDQHNYIFGACQCELPWGGAINMGASVNAYVSQVASPCTPQLRTCQASNGLLSNSGQFQTCQSPCTLPWGGSINPGESVTAWLTSSGTCTSEQRTCNNGVLSGSYTFQSCTNAPCTLPWGGTIVHGASVTAYQYIKQAPTCTSSQLRTCNNGTLSGTFTNQTCTTCGGTVYPLCTSSVGCTSYCWYMSTAADSCTNRCVARGGCVAAGVVAYGSGGTDASCLALAQAVHSAGAIFTSDEDGDRTGCYLDTGNNRIERADNLSTTCDASWAEDQRFCSCTN